MTKRLPTEFAINMNLDKMMILQQSELKHVNDFNYFDEHSPCHLYFICKRPRLSIDPKKYEVTKEFISLTFKVQRQDEFEEKEYKFANTFKRDDIELVAEYPFNIFQLVTNDETLVDAKVAPFLQSLISEKYLDLQVLYIGQSYGVEGARTAPDRLKSHSTLQGIYAEAISNNPDSEIYLALASFAQINIMMMDGRTKFTEADFEADTERRNNVNNRLNWEGINDQQKINFTEAALIKYFQPSYNKIYKDSFPNPAHSTYSECYELDINAVCIEMQTYEMINCCMYSESVKSAPWHMERFLLNSEEDRKSMFEII